MRYHMGNMGLAWRVPGIILNVIFFFVTQGENQSSAHVALNLIVMFAAVFCLWIGMNYALKYKGQNPYWAVCAVFTCPGVLMVRSSTGEIKRD